MIIQDDFWDNLCRTGLQRQVFYDAVLTGEDEVATQAAYQKFESARDACTTAYDDLLNENFAIERYREDIKRLANVIGTTYYEEMIGDKEGWKYLPRSYFFTTFLHALVGGTYKEEQKVHEAELQLHEATARSSFAAERDYRYPEDADYHVTVPLLDVENSEEMLRISFEAEYVKDRENGKTSDGLFKMIDLTKTDKHRKALKAFKKAVDEYHTALSGIHSIQVHRIQGFLDQVNQNEGGFGKLKRQLIQYIVCLSQNPLQF